MSEKWVKKINVQKLGHSFDIFVTEDAAVFCTIDGKTIAAAELIDGNVKFLQKQKVMVSGTHVGIGGLSIRNEDFEALLQAQREAQQALLSPQIQPTPESPVQEPDPEPQEAAEPSVEEAAMKKPDKEEYTETKEPEASFSDKAQSEEQEALPFAAETPADTEDPEQSAEQQPAEETATTETDIQEPTPEPDVPEETEAEVETSETPAVEETVTPAAAPEEKSMEESGIEDWKVYANKRKAALKAVDSWKRSLRNFHDKEKKGQKYCVHTFRIGNNKYRFVERQIPGKGVIINPDYKIFDELPRVGGVPKQYGELMFWDYFFEDKGWQRVRVLTHNEEICLNIIKSYGHFATPKEIKRTKKNSTFFGKLTKKKS